MDKTTTFRIEVSDLSPQEVAASLNDLGAEHIMQAMEEIFGQPLSFVIIRMGKEVLGRAGGNHEANDRPMRPL